MNSRLYFIALLLLSFTANADKPFYTGLWVYAIDIKMPGMPQSDLKIVQKCVREVNDVKGAVTRHLRAENLRYVVVPVDEN